MSQRLVSIPLFVVGLLVGSMFAVAIPASAVGPFGPAVVLLDTCTGSGGDAAIATDGTTRGFAECTTNQTSFGRIWFFRHRTGVAPFAQATPYDGRVIAVAWDGLDNTYVVFEQINGQLKIAKRIESSGVYAPPTTLSAGSGALQQNADIVASNGLWWVVWREPVGPGGEFAHSQLFQRHTLLGVQGRTRITTQPGNTDDSHPSLAFRNGLVTLVWSRATDLNRGGPSVLRIANSSGGPWTSSQLTTSGTANTDPDVTVYGPITYVTWTRDGFTAVASNNGGPFGPRVFSQPGSGPSVAASGTNLFVAWTANPGDRAYLAERKNNIWTASQAAGPSSATLVVLGQATKARIIYRTPTQVILRVQI